MSIHANTMDIEFLLSDSQNNAFSIKFYEKISTIKIRYSLIQYFAINYLLYLMKIQRVNIEMSWKCSQFDTKGSNIQVEEGKGASLMQ